MAALYRPEALVNQIEARSVVGSDVPEFGLTALEFGLALFHRSQTESL